MKISASVSVPKLGNNAASFTGGSKAALAKWAAKTLNEMQDYPTQLSHVKYRRTGRYGSNWRMQVNQTDAKVSNSTEYGQFLGGESQVGWAASRGWKRLRVVATENAVQLREDVLNAARKAIS